MGINVDFVTKLLLQTKKKPQNMFEPETLEVPAMPPIIPTGAPTDRETWRTQITPPQPTAPPPATPTQPLLPPGMILGPTGPVPDPTLAQTVPQTSVPSVPATPAAPADPTTATPPTLDPSAFMTDAERELKTETGRRYNKGVWTIDGVETSNPKKVEAARKAGKEVVTVTEPGKDRDKKWSTWDKVLSAITGWATGGLAGGIAAATDRNYFEKIGNQNKIARLAPQVQLEQQMEQRKAATEATRSRPILARAELQRKIATDKARFATQLKIAADKGRQDAEKWVPWTDPKTGNVYKQYRNKTDGEALVPLEDPQTGDQMQDPNARLYNYVDPQTGTTVQLKGNQLATVGATIAAGNAQRTQAAATQNADAEMEAQKTNIANAFNYSKQLFDNVINIAKASGEAQEGVTAAEGLYTQLQQATDKLNTLDPILNEKAYEEALKNFNDKQEKFYNAVSKTASGAKAVDLMTKANLTRPGKVTATKITPSLVKPGKPVARSKDPLGLFR
jgi:hypothetical protein